MSPEAETFPSTSLASVLMPAPFVRRLAALTFGLYLFGASLAMVVVAGLGLSPWDVFHQGVARTVDRPLGSVLIATSFAVLALWIPLRQRPGIGTIGNAIVVGLSLEATLPLLPDVSSWWAKTFMLAGGVLLNGVASGLYIGAGLGPGPRDGLMTGLAERRWSIRLVRTGIEAAVLGAGWLLGGTVGLGTVIYAIGIGPLVQVFLPWFTIDTTKAENPHTKHTNS